MKLQLRYFGYLMRGTDSFEKTLMLRKIEGVRVLVPFWSHLVKGTLQ